MANTLLVVLVLLPAVLTYLLKSNASVGFLALCGGFALITLSGSDIEHLVGQTRITSLTSNDVDLLLLGVPLLFTLLLTYKSVATKHRRYFQLIPALCAGGLLAIVAGPMFSNALQTDFLSSPLWKDLQDAQTYIVGIGLLISLLMIWSTGFSHSKKHR
ncbi:MAG TPA: hypothetical protein VHD84_01565 [Candidatus Saccharimonadales bacterium]|nr:hypothetical protein [Candidatus Saccharimonadales bacterium]